MIQIVVVKESHCFVHQFEQIFKAVLALVLNQIQDRKTLIYTFLVRSINTNSVRKGRNEDESMTVEVEFESVPFY